MMSFGSTGICSSSLLGSFVSAEIYGLLVDTDIGAPLLGLPVKINAFEPGRVVALSAAIVCVLVAGGLSQVDPPIVIANTIDVIDFNFWPPAGSHQPNDAMGISMTTASAARNITIGEYATEDAANYCLSTAVFRLLRWELARL
jgi:hypothetical protein